jgi:acyl carrier protein
MEHAPSLQAEIASLLLNNMNVEASSVHEDLIETGLLDSLKIVELLVELEQHFGMTIRFADVQIDHFRSVANMATFVNNYIGCKRMSSAEISVAMRRDSRLPIAEKMQ